MKEYFIEIAMAFDQERVHSRQYCKAVEYMNDGYNWVVDIDLEKFFDTSTTIIS